MRGLVQGVAFRWSVARTAESVGVTGWARNRADGSVEAVFEGDPDAVESMVGWCRHGPRGAQVERVETHEEAPEGIAGFSIH